MKTKLEKLIDVKSIMTLALTLVFCVLALCGAVTAEQFVTIFTVIVGFYFGTQAQKRADMATAAVTGIAVATVNEEDTVPPEPVDNSIYR